MTLHRMSQIQATTMGNRSNGASRKKKKRKKTAKMMTSTQKSPAMMNRNLQRLTMKP